MAWRPFRNIGLKIAALVLGTLLWFTVSSPRLERSVRVPIEYIGVPASLELLGDTIDLAYVHLRGPENVISRLQPGDVRVVLDMTNATSVDHGSFQLRTDQIVAPAGAEAMWVDPHEVTLTIAVVGQASVPVVATIEGSPAAGFSRGAATVEPARVDIVGPEDAVRRLKSVPTAPVSIAGARETVTQTVTIAVPDATLRLRDPQKARVTVDVHKGGGK